MEQQKNCTQNKLVKTTWRLPMLLPSKIKIRSIQINVMSMHSGVCSSNFWLVQLLKLHNALKASTKWIWISSTKNLNNITFLKRWSIFWKDAWGRKRLSWRQLTVRLFLMFKSLDLDGRRSIFILSSRDNLYQFL